MNETAIEKTLDDRVAVVTGAGRGIGRAIAIALAQRGADIVAGDIDLDGAESTCAQVRDLGRRAVPRRCDVSRRADVDALLQAAVDEFARLDILVNNAGITRDNLLVRMTEEQWQQVIDINLKGTFFGCQAAAKIMMRARSGKIVNVASITGLIGNPGQANYTASKAGVVALTKTVARELAGRSINVNAVAPGYIATDMTAEMNAQAQDAFLQQIPLKRAGTPGDVAAVVCFLCSPQADYITGECIVVDGGLTMR